MKKTRNTFAVTGSPGDVKVVLNALRFKGLVTIPLGNIVTDETISEAHKYNRSIVFSATDLVGTLPTNTYTIDVVTMNAKASPSKYIICVNDDEMEIAKQFAEIADETNSDIGDHKSNTSTGGTDGPSVQNCAYCKYLKGDTESVESNERTAMMLISMAQTPLISRII